MKVKTNDVRNSLVGEARKAIKDAAGSNGILSKVEAKKLPKEVARAADAVRARDGRVTVDTAVDEFAGKLSKVLAAVDKKGKGVLSKAEAESIYDPDLRASVLAARAKLLGGAAPADGPGVVFDRLKSLSAGLSYSSVSESCLKPFLSGAKTSKPLTADLVRDMLAPQWDALKKDIWTTGGNLDDSDPGLSDGAAVVPGALSAADSAATLDDFAGGYAGNAALVDYLRATLTELTVVDLCQKDADGNAVDCGPYARFIGGKTPDGHVAGVFVGMCAD